MRSMNDIQPDKSRAAVSAAPAHRGRFAMLARMKMAHIVLLVVVLIAAGVAAAWNAGLFGSRVKADRYQAVFLDGGEVYFGKLHDYDLGRPYLTDVHYFPGSTDAKSVNEQAKLVKLGQEVHAPDSEIVLNKSAIRFVENLSSDSPIVKAIIDGQKASTSSGGGIQR